MHDVELPLYSPGAGDLEVLGCDLFIFGGVWGIESFDG